MSNLKRAIKASDVRDIHGDAFGLCDCKVIMDFILHISGILAEEYVDRMKKAAQESPIAQQCRQEAKH